MQKAGCDNELQSLKLVKQKAVIWQEKVNTQTWNNKKPKWDAKNYYTKLLKYYWKILYKKCINIFIIQITLNISATRTIKISDKKL